MTNIEPGLREVNGINVVPLDGLWNAVLDTPNAYKMSAALQYAGCKFYDEDFLYISSPSVSVVGLGGDPVASVNDTNNEIANSIQSKVERTKVLMSSAAAITYLNSGEKSLAELYKITTELGHFSIAHTVQVNMLLAGISEGAELEISLQRDLLHIAKVTNARTSVQTRPPVVVRNASHLSVIKELKSFTDSLLPAITPEAPSLDDYEAINSYHPINKATMIILSGTLSNFRKFVHIRKDKGKEEEVRNLADIIGRQLSLLWPEIIS